MNNTAVYLSFLFSDSSQLLDCFLKKIKKSVFVFEKHVAVCYIDVNAITIIDEDRRI